MMNKVKLFVLFLSAGIGKRMQQEIKKHFILINNKPIFLYSLQVFLKINLIDYIYILHNPHDKIQFLNFIDKFIKNKIDRKKINLIEGGKTRSKSVYQGLCKISTKANLNDFIIIHDSARPFVKNEDVKNIILNLKSYTSVTLSSIISDTVKQINPELKIITSHPHRSLLRTVQTPQGFHYGFLKKAYENYNYCFNSVTDDTQFMKFLNKTTKIIESNSLNIKITTSNDLIIAKAILENLSDF